MNPKQRKHEENYTKAILGDLPKTSDKEKKFSNKEITQYELGA